RGAALGLAGQGAKVAVIDRDLNEAEAVAEEIRAAGGEALPLAVDVRDEAAVEAAFDRIVDELGTPWFLLNSAGIGTIKPFLEMDGATWREMLAVNLEGTFYCAREAARAMVAGGGGGRIVNIGSQIGLKGGFHQTHYAASKSGVHGFSRAAARELAEHGINVNSIAPGPIETDMLMGTGEDWLNWKRKELPLKRFGQVEEIVPTVLLLASPAGGGYITGAVMNLSGGDVMAD
ncbi:MAG: SDR family oxidoreductase, partial [Solirubrobacteraceae bacterium]|nr:SDR family oxidoreductase [Solirubrobacteraceae bacterium]